MLAVLSQIISIKVFAMRTIANNNSLLHSGYITYRHEEQQNHHHNGSMVMHFTKIQISECGR